MQWVVMGRELIFGTLPWYQVSVFPLEDWVFI